MDGQDVRSSLRVDVITELSALEDLRPQWLNLLSSTSASIGFSAPGAVLAWYRHVERYSKVHVVAVWREHELIGLAPFSATRLGAFRLYCSAGAGYGFYGGPLLGRAPEPVAQAIGGHIFDLVRSGLAAVYLRRMPLEHPLLGVLDKGTNVTCSAMGADETNSVVSFAQMPDPDEYFARVRRKHDVARNTRRLAKHGLSLDIVPADLDPDAALNSMRDMLLRRFGEDLRIFRGAHNRTLTREMVHGLIADDHARVFSIMADGRRIAVTVDLQIGTRMFGYAMAYEPDLNNFGIGHIELYESLRRAHSSGITEVDLGSSGFAYKRHWANSDSQFRTVAITAAGRRGAMTNHLRRATIAMHRRVVHVRDTGLPIL